MRYLVLSLILTIFLGSCADGEEKEIVVRKKLGATLTLFISAYVSAKNDLLTGGKEGIRERWVSFIERELSDSLSDRSLNPFVVEDQADLRVEAIVRPGRGFPRLGRHFDLITEYIDFLNIKLIDAKTHTLLGEVEYNRARFAANPPHLVRDMLNKLINED